VVQLRITGLQCCLKVLEDLLCLSPDVAPVWLAGVRIGVIYRDDERAVSQGRWQHPNGPRIPA
jgi:hypothetical protein